MNSSTRFTTTLFTLTALALFASACGKKQAGGPPSAPPLMVLMAPAIKADLPVVITTYGTTQDKESVDMVPQVSGQLTHVLFQEGAIVTNGQPLFQIDPRDYQTRVQQAGGMIAADKSSLELARITLDRNQPLLEKRLISQELFDTIKNKVTALEAQLAIDQAALEQALLNLSRCTLVSPIEGICSKRYVDAGNLVAAGMTRLTNIRNNNPLRLECTLSEQYLPAIRSALSAGPIPVEITPRGDTNSYPGTLSFIDNAVDPMTGTILLRGEAPNPNRALWAKQFIDIRIVVNFIPNAILVPESAVQFGKDGAYLYVVNSNNVSELRHVKAGLRHNTLLQLTEGVGAGESVITTGLVMMRPGATVMDASKLPPQGASKK
ncbi:MAG: efflux RND transporter periplasmic adaptor subunit [bacterium]